MTMKKFAFGIVAICFAALAGMAFATEHPTKDPIAVGSGMYKLLFENQKVRVMEVTIKPGEKVAMHSHPDHLGYILSGGKLKMTTSKGEAQEVEGKQGDVIFSEPVTHDTVNTGTTTVKVIVVELKGAGAAPEHPKAK